MSTNDKAFVAKNGIVANGAVTINSTALYLGNTPISANGSFGSAGQALFFDGSKNYFGTVSASPAGSNTQIQFNDSGSANGSSGLVFDKTANNLTISNTTISTLFSGPLNTGNSTVNAIVNSTSHKIQDAASAVTVNSTALTIGSNVIANTSVVSAPSLLAGANVVLNTSSLFIGNSTVNAFVNSSSFLLNGASVGAQAANQTLMEAASNVTTFVSPGNFKYHPGAVKSLISARVTFNAVTGNISSVDTATDIITWSTTHGFTTGEQIITDSTNWPGPISTNQQVYFVNALSSTTFALYLTYDSAVADTSRVNLTSAGSGTRGCKKLTLNDTHSLGMRTFMPLYFTPAGLIANVQFVVNWESPFSSNAYSVFPVSSANLDYVTLPTKNTSSYTSSSLASYSGSILAISNTYVTAIAIGDQ